ncbi:hypothetical protein LIER_20767 [Lithospermum erythrorhizon]|uniref:Uncharacterized protein n=1 Tax=Lithospermum erythrorhizon TaxID=34254 RepID=A0AAV3QRS9_LITER
MRLSSGADQVYRPLVVRDVVDRPLSPGEILLAAKETAPPNTVPLESMQGKRPIAFNKVKVMKKVASSPRPSTTAELPPRPAQVANPTPHSSPIVVELNPSSSLPNMDLPHEPSSSSLAGKRPSDEAVLQGKEKWVKATSELSYPPKDGIPPSPFPASDPLMAAWFFTPDFLTPPYTLPWGQQICVDTPFKSNLQSFHSCLYILDYEYML